jgi:hypothetical protein
MRGTVHAVFYRSKSDESHPCRVICVVFDAYLSVSHKFHTKRQKYSISKPSDHQISNQPSTTMLQHYRAAISLNNIGVALIERHQYQQAMEVLKSAITALKIGALLSNQKHMTRGISIQVELKKALGYLAKAKPSTRTRSDGSMHVNVVSNDAIDAASFKVLRKGPTMSQAYAIRIDELDFDALKARSPDVEVAVSLYNLAVAHLCRSQELKKPELCLKLVTNANKLLHASHAVLQERQIGCKDTEHCSYMLHLEALVLNNLVHLAIKHEHGNEITHEGVRLYSKFVRLRSEAIENSGFGIQSDSMNQGAAAA